jgi:hypothetical protein
MIQRRELGPPPPGCGLFDVASRDDCVMGLRHRLAHTPPGGVPLRGLDRTVRPDIANGWRKHFGTVDELAEAYPQLFVIDRSDPRNPMVTLRQ